MRTQLLPVKLEVDELLIRGRELAERCAELKDVEERKKTAMGAFKEEIDAIEVGISSLTKIVKERQEYREVEIRELRNEERMTMDTIRLDTGEIISFRALQGHERNLSLFPSEVEGKDTAG